MTPMTCPRSFSSGPPLLPPEMGAVKRIHSVSAVFQRPLTLPSVMRLIIPNWHPMAVAFSPRRGGASDQGSGFALPEYMEDNRLVTWGMNCVYETRIGGGEQRQGGRCTWTLYLPTMEVFAYFRPEE